MELVTEISAKPALMVLKEIEKKALSGYLPIIGPEKGRYLVETVRKSGIKKVLEIGTLIGYSAILMSMNMSDDGKIYTIEINPHSAEVANYNIRRAQLGSKVQILTGNALELIPGISETFDMAFIDASKEEYFDYLRLSEPKLRRGAFVFADNVKIFAGRMSNYLDYVRNSGKYSSRYIEVGSDGVEISEKLF